MSCYACALLKSTKCSKHVGGKASQTLKVIWPSTPQAPRVTEYAKSIARAAIRRGEFGPPSPLVVEQAQKESAMSVDSNATFDAILSVFCTEVTLAAQRAHIRGVKLNLTVPFNESAILKAAETIRQPPVALLRYLLLAEGATPSQVRNAMADPKSLSRLLTGGFTRLFRADLASRLNSMRAHDMASEFEDRISEMLATQIGRSAFLRENDARAASKESGLTPDFLFTTPIIINGRPVHWLDAKNYYWYGSPLTARSVISQAEKYTKAFGPGAFAFRYGADPTTKILSKNDTKAPQILTL